MFYRAVSSYEKGKAKARAYHSRFHGGSFLKYLFFLLALCFVGLLVALGSGNQPIRKLVHMPHFTFGGGCTDPLTGMAVKCGTIIEGGPNDEKWIEEVITEEDMKKEEAKANPPPVDGLTTLERDNKPNKCVLLMPGRNSMLASDNQTQISMCWLSYPGSNV
eukprot:1141838-Pelagomonas_calceolata.AAC.4